jgi:hypothetical protein
MDTFDVNLLSQVKALDKKMSISQEQLHLRRKAINEEKGKGRYPGRRPARDAGCYDGECQTTPTIEEKENIIDITI